MPKQVADIVWNRTPSRHTSGQGAYPHRKRFWLQTAGMTVAGILLFRFGDHRVIPFFLWSLTTLILAGLFFYDPILQGIDTIGNVFARGIGRGLTWLLLIPCFYIVFGLGRLYLIIARKDLLKRKWSPQATTYWCDRSNAKAPPRYQEQS